MKGKVPEWRSPKYISRNFCVYCCQPFFVVANLYILWRTPVDSVRVHNGLYILQSRLWDRKIETACAQLSISCMFFYQWGACTLQQERLGTWVQACPNWLWLKEKQAPAKTEQLVKIQFLLKFMLFLCLYLNSVWVALTRMSCSAVMLDRDPKCWAG